MIDLRLGDCLEVMRGMADKSVDAVITDPPYFRVKGEWWDDQWDTASGFIDWVGLLCNEWKRILKPNGSLYVFASPRMGARVEVKIGDFFHVLNRIRWVKEAGWHKKTKKEELRSYLSPWEEIIFAEQKNGDFDYRYSDGTLNFRIMKPVREYLDSERQRAGLTIEQINRATNTEMASHWFTHPSQWSLPTKFWYERLREIFAGLDHGGEYLRREYEDLRREYEDLRREYEDLRRPFCVSNDVPHTDVWNFDTVPFHANKHPCEKPLPMMMHILEVSTRNNMTILDPFMGSGTTGVACVQTGRNFIGIEIDPTYYAIAERRIREAQQQPTLLEVH